MVREYIIDEKNNFFIKKYPQCSHINKKVALEYEKGRILCELINYPKPIKFDGNEIYYELLNIKQSLHEAKRNNELQYSDLFSVGRQLRIMHDNGIVHGDFSTSNIIITNRGEIYFIDASFSFYNVIGDGEVVIYSDDNYNDIAFFIVKLKTDNSLLQPWKFFQFDEVRKMINSFLKGYFYRRSKVFDHIRELKYENRAIMNSIKYCRETDAFVLWRYGMIMVLLTLLIYNKYTIYKHK